ncbi:MAG TPA: R3H domain-containing nucleic acid-binding protein [Candidatus Saccharicenans sp.]|jgi:spoIIIJ-associated protein|nr:Jag N-terminal domain-containing protein [Candidatus Saccharicenans sp.]HOE13596.1 R3H domain-containing nucleic acid-binding protein [Candidatus Saccharicenans sp.]HOJ25861.1 R3H domain-containing nucleic acid-binding protein [Candidatus Saccharicenans sp.]HOL45029.1 R3H domain-containing nucleic acid-binding protein [Candidatus Saccharicenans sp.]HOM93448.1 R3H domain-containing nucleic acid-binding protein [Candidatus Saccharicenans sp.]
MEKEVKNNRQNGQQVVEKKEFTGRSLEDVLSLAEHVLKVPREELDYEIVTEKTRLFGLKNKEIVIRAWPRQVNEIQIVDSFLKELLALLPFDLSYEIKRRDQLIYVVFGGEDKHWLLKDDGALLLAIQHLLNKISSVKVQVDCEFFRRRKEKQLKEYATEMAEKVKETGQEEILDVMNPYERRIVHIAVNQIPGLTTESLGEGFLKKIRIFKVENSGQKKRPDQD